MFRSASLGLLLAGALISMGSVNASAASLGTTGRALGSVDRLGQFDTVLPLQQVQGFGTGTGRPAGGRNVTGGGGPRVNGGGGGGGRRVNGGGGGRRYGGGGGGYDPGAAAAVGIMGAVIGLAAEQAAQDQARREYRQRRYYRQQRYYYDD
jgi:hypothetical protein